MSPEALLEARLAQIHAGPKGPNVGAFFDFDGTLIDGFSATSWLKRRLRRGEFGLREFSEVLSYSLMEEPGEADFHELVAAGVRRMAGLSEEALSAAWKECFEQEFASWQFPEAWALVKAHQAQRHTIVIASSATRYQLQACAAEFGIAHLLCTAIEIDNGVATGRLAGAPVWREQKAQAVVAFAEQHDLELTQSYGYANGSEDLPFLSALGHPATVNAEPGLAAAAEALQWTQLRFARRRIPATAKLRTAGSYAAMGATLLAGLGWNVLGAPQRRAINLVTSIAPDLGLAAAGVELRVQGEQHLWSARPCVFIFNHQSPLDLVIAMNLMRRDATGVVKKEAAELFGWGHFMKFAGMAFVDRGDPQKAREALAPAVEKLKAGISLGIAPEGTRSYSPRLNRFKKGAFQMARQAGVPIVPVILRNAGEVMHRNARWIRPGIVDVRVLPPIDVGAWKVQELDLRIDELREEIQQLLDHWPETVQ